MTRVLFAGFASVIVGLVGCTESNSDAVIAQYQRGEDAIAAGSGADFLATMTPECAEQLEQAVVLAMRASEEEVKALGPSQMGLVVALRNRVPIGRLRMMDPQDVLTWQIEQGMLIVDKEYDVVPMSVVVRANQAEMQMGVKVQRSSRTRIGRRGLGLATGLISGSIGGSKVEKIDGLVHTFRRIGETWYADFQADQASYDTSFIRAANQERIPVWEAVSQEEEDAFGSIKPEIWSPQAD
jgi:hypothetical protein